MIEVSFVGNLQVQLGNFCLIGSPLIGATTRVSPWQTLEDLDVECSWFSCTGDKEVWNLEIFNRFQPKGA